MKYGKRHIESVLKDEGYGNMKYDMWSEYVCCESKDKKYFLKVLDVGYKT